MKREEAILNAAEIANILEKRGLNGAANSLRESLKDLCTPRNPWVKTADRLPTKDDEGVYGTVLAFNPVLLDGEYGACTCITAQTVIDYPDWWIKWMPIPLLPEVTE